MNWARVARCNVCDRVQADASGWSVAVQKVGSPVEWLPWDEGAAREAGAIHICPAENCRQEIMQKMLKQAGGVVKVN